jgi:UDP-2,3-diacylglucosamine hydrolase
MIRIARSEPVLFASDLHLGPQAQGTAQDALARLSRHGQHATHLFLLGDIFEMWVGDDGADALALELASRLQRLSESGTHIWLMRGNRDFLMDVPVPGYDGPSYSARCGAVMLEDPCLIDLHGQPVLLAHGDALCTDDAPYQQWRITCRHPAWQQAFLAKPLAERLVLGKGARQASESGKRETAEALMDVNQSAVDAALDAAMASVMVHGHTHRPDHHRWSHRGSARERIVLTDWDVDAHRGNLLAWQNGLPVAVQRD